MDNESASAEEYKGESSQEINSKDQFVFPQKHTDTESKLIRNDELDVFGKNLATEEMEKTYSNLRLFQSLQLKNIHIFI